MTLAPSRHIITAAAGALALGAALCACNSQGCIDNKSSIPLAYFYDSATLDRINVGGLTVGGVGAPADSLLASDATLSEVYLPLRSDRSETSFFFSVTVTPADTTMAPYDVTDVVDFTYESIPYFASADCGAMYRYRITSVEHTSLLIDSIGLPDSLITNVNTMSVQIFMRVNHTDEPQP